MNPPMPLDERLKLHGARAIAWAWRFRTLAFANSLFRSDTGPMILERRFFGYTLHLDVSRSNAQRQLYLVGERFMGEAALLEELMAPGATVVDVGANIGYYALHSARCVGPTGRVVAFEPEPDNLVELRMNVDRNRLRNVEVHAVALGAHRGQVPFARGINGGVLDSHAAGDIVQVSIVPLDEALEGRVDLMKIDVEGYEGEVLSGARRTIERWRPNLFVEIHPRLMAPGHSAAAVLDFLHRYYPGVRLYEPSRQGGFLQKLAERYLGRGIRPLEGTEAVKASCREGKQDTFWAICRRAPA
jgi:FkbM family methyltransferase